MWHSVYIQTLLHLLINAAPFFIKRYSGDKKMLPH